MTKKDRERAMKVAEATDPKHYVVRTVGGYDVHGPYGYRGAAEQACIDLALDRPGDTYAVRLNGADIFTRTYTPEGALFDLLALFMSARDFATSNGMYLTDDDRNALMRRAESLAERYVRLGGDPVDVPLMPPLIDGRVYWLGATWGRYLVTPDGFTLGNAFVDRADTVFAGEPVVVDGKVEGGYE